MSECTSMIFFEVVCLGDIILIQCRIIHFAHFFLYRTPTYGKISLSFWRKIFLHFQIKTNKSRVNEISNWNLFYAHIIQICMLLYMTWYISIFETNFSFENKKENSYKDPILYYSITLLWNINTCHQLLLGVYILLYNFSPAESTLHHYHRHDRPVQIKKTYNLPTPHKHIEKLAPTSFPFFFSFSDKHVYETYIKKVISLLLFRYHGKVLLQLLPLQRKEKGLPLSSHIFYSKMQRIKGTGKEKIGMDCGIKFRANDILCVRIHIQKRYV